MVIIKIDIENVGLIVVFFLILSLGYGSLSNNQLSHAYPFGYLASDAFQHQTRAMSIFDAGHYQNEASYIVFGLDDVVGFYPPSIYHMAGLLSQATGLETYDTIYFMMFFGASLAVLLMYFLIRTFNKHVAMLSVPLTVLLFHGPLYTGFTFGHWPSIMSQVFLVGFLWYLSRFSLKKSWIFLGVFFAAMFLTHTSEAVFSVLVWIIAAGYRILKTKKILPYILHGVKGGVLALLIASYFIPIFQGVWSVRQPFEYMSLPAWDAPTMFIADFGWLLAVMGIGVIASLLFIKKQELMPFVLALSLLGLSYMNYVGFNIRALQLRFFWPLYLSFLFGFGIFTVGKLIVKKWKVVYSLGIAVGVVILLVSVQSNLFPSYTKIQSPGVLNPFGTENSFHYEALQWLSDNTEEDARLYFLYGVIYNQDALLRNAEREHYLIIPEDYIEAVQAREIRREFYTETPGDGGGGGAVRTGLFSFRFAADELTDRISDMDLCAFDYVIFDQQPQQDNALIQYNLIIAQELVQNDFIEQVYANPVVVVLKNDQPGADCIEPRTFE